MKLFVETVLLLSLIAITLQDITGRKGCDCSVCKGVDNKIDPFIGKKIGNGGGGKSSCNLCEQRKEMLRLEKEKQRQMQKCPFELLGSPTLKGKSSQEIFDDFRELIIPSQNGFFDMMRGIVRTMHFSSEAELKLAKEKEARELAKKKKEEKEEAAKKRKEPKRRLKDETVSLNSPEKPKVTVVLKQTPCGQVMPPVEKIEPEKTLLFKRLPKEANDDIYRIPEEEVVGLQTFEFENNGSHDKDYLNLDLKENLLHSDLIDQLIGYNMLSSGSPQNEKVGVAENQEKAFSFESSAMQSSTEPSFVGFLNKDELKVLSNQRNPEAETDMNLNMLTTNTGVELQTVNEENAQNIDQSLAPALA